MKTRREPSFVLAALRQRCVEAGPACHAEGAPGPASNAPAGQAGKPSVPTLSSASFGLVQLGRVLVAWTLYMSVAIALLWASAWSGRERASESAPAQHRTRPG